jgi:hypothetical protein
LVVSINLWQIYYVKIWLISNLVKHTSKSFQNSEDSKHVLIFSLALMVVEFLAIL